MGDSSEMVTFVYQAGAVELPDIPLGHPDAPVKLVWTDGSPVTPDQIAMFQAGIGVAPRVKLSLWGKITRFFAK